MCRVDLTPLCYGQPADFIIYPKHPLTFTGITQTSNVWDLILPLFVPPRASRLA